MKTHIIYNSVNPKSNHIANEAIESFRSYKNWNPILWDGCTPKTLKLYEEKYGVTAGTRTKKYSNKSLYETKYSCFYSHFSVWHKCAEENEIAIIAEHDTIAKEDFVLPEVDWNEMVGVQLSTESIINSPKHHYYKYREKLNSVGKGLHKIWYKHPTVGYTFAGATGYMLSAKACQWLVNNCLEMGWFQNDCLFSDKDFPLYYVYPSPIEYVHSKELKSSSRGW